MQQLRRYFKTPQQVFFALLAATFVFFLCVVGLWRSFQNAPMYSLQMLLEQTPLDFQSLSGQDEIKLQFNDFHRVQIEKGKLTWDIKAKDAKYYPKDNVSYVNEPELVVQREDQNPLNLKSKAAKLFLAKQKLKNVELEGDVHFFIKDEISAKTDFVAYEAESKHISSERQVIVEGEGFQVSGTGFLMEVDEKRVSFLSNVKSRFDLKKIKKAKK